MAVDVAHFITSAQQDGCILSAYKFFLFFCFVCFSAIEIITRIVVMASSFYNCVHSYQAEAK